MRFHYDKNVDAFYIRLNDAPYEESVEMGDGVIFDYDPKGKIVGIEILDASQKFSREMTDAILRGKILQIPSASGVYSKKP
ncbi:MAG: DUF2283 domain-containing protein [Patescibacteria group bacterium]